MRLVRALVATVIVVAFLAGGAVMADGYFRRTSEQRIADSLQRHLGLPQPPSLSLGGWPFAAALVTGRIPTATVMAPLAPMSISGHDVTLRDLRVEGRDLVVSSDEVVIAHLVADARLDYRDLSNLAGTSVDYAGDGRLAATYAVEFLGREITATASAAPSVDADALRVTLADAQISAAGFTLTPELSQFVLGQVVKPIDVRLDLGLRLESVDATPDGLDLHATATDFHSPLA